MEIFVAKKISLIIKSKKNSMIEEVLVVRVIWVKQYLEDTPYRFFLFTSKILSERNDNMFIVRG